MRQLPKLFLLLLAACALGSLSEPALAEDPPKAKPADPAPPIDPKKPSGNPAPAEPPKPGDPAPTEPKPDEPAPQPPAPEDPEEAARKAEAAKKQAEEDEKKRLDEEEKERQADEAARKKREGEQPPVEAEEPRAEAPAPPRPGPPGMVYLPPADPTAKPPAEAPDGAAPAPPAGAPIGTKNEDLARLLGTRPPETRKLFDFERPQHRRLVRECYFDTCEVTNQQYWVFLKDHTTSIICEGKYPTLVDVAGWLLKTPADKVHTDDVAWRQLAEANKEALLQALPGLVDDKNPWPSPYKTAVLPKRDLVLIFYSRRPPDDWPGMVPQAERLNHPVRFVSGLDAEAFAEWAGKHLQTEFEYEWAARGPDAPEFPWGKIWHNNAEYCNWGAKVQDQKTHEADTWAVGSHPRGRSWVGAMDTVGNVAEWTGSLFWLYPGANPKLEHEMLGAVHIIRGGTAVDQEQLVLRPAARNFIGTGFNSAPPYLQNRYAWVGFRCAWWFQPGANQVPFIERRVTRGGRIRAPKLNRFGEADTPGDLDLERVAGSVAENFSGPDAQNGEWVRGKARAVVLIPRRWLVDSDLKPDVNTLNFAKSKSKEGLLKESESESPLVLLGAFHADVKLPKVWVRRKLTPEEKAAEAKDKKRGRVEAPPLIEGSCAAGSYILAIWHKRLCLVDGSREFVCSFTAPDKVASVEVKKVKEGQAPVCKIEVDDTVNLINGIMAVPLATGKSADPLQWVIATFSLEAQAEDLVTENGWR